MKLLFILEEGDDFIIEHAYYKMNKLQTNEIFRNRFTEGCFNTLIMRHLYKNATKFKEYFRLSPDQFDYVLSLIENDNVKLPTNFVKTPVTPAEILAVTQVMNWLLLLYCITLHGVFQTIRVKIFYQNTIDYFCKIWGYGRRNLVQGSWWKTYRRENFPLTQHWTKFSGARAW